MIEKVELVKQQIEFYENASGVCLMGALLFGGLTVLIYFALHIKIVFWKLSGIHKTKEITRIHQNNMNSGKIIRTYGQGKIPVYQYEEDKTAPLTEMEEETILLEDFEGAQADHLEFQSEESVLLGQPEQWI